MSKQSPSPSVIKRLPRYYRFLSMLKEDNVTRISSSALAEKMGSTASQVRQDLNCFGGFGQQGYGYNVIQLKAEIAEILGLNKRFNAVIIGAGNLGRAMATHMAFEKRGFNLIGIFDKKESMAGQMINGMLVRHISGLDEFCREFQPSVAVLCIPDEEAIDTADLLVKLKIKGIWNFSHHDLSLKFPDIVVENVHLSDSLMTFCYKVNEAEK